MPTLAEQLSAQLLPWHFSPSVLSTWQQPAPAQTSASEEHEVRLVAAAVLRVLCIAAVEFQVLLVDAVAHAGVAKLTTVIK